MLALENISVAVKIGSALEKTILRDVSLEIARGEFAVLIGSNGAGKSTLLAALTGAAKVASGRIFIDEADVTAYCPQRRCRLIASVTQDPKVGTVANLSIEENLSLALMRGKSRTLSPHSTCARRDLFRQKLSILKMGLENRLDAAAGQLSGGQRQALSLIMALMADYRLLLLDEITAALDPISAATVMECAAKIITAENKTCLMVTHNMQHALQYGDRLVALREGRIARVYDQQEKKRLNVSELTQCFG